MPLLTCPQGYHWEIPVNDNAPTTDVRVLCPVCGAVVELVWPDLEKSTSAAVTAPPGPVPAIPGYEILEELGRGGMGVVYKARQMKLDRLVALKVLPLETGSDPAFAERFGREARALAKLNHPNIVTVHDFGQAAGQSYFIMEHVDGESLRWRLRAGPMPPQEALPIVVRICDALEYAHDEGIVHRDIKPENILLDKKGRVKIADFGLAKLLVRKAADYPLTGPLQVMGTLRYMAPEQLEQPLEVDHRADIYSLGVMFYEMLTGELPLGRFALPSQKAPVDARLDEIVLRALEKEPQRRFQQVSEFRMAMESLRNQPRNPIPDEGKTKTAIASGTAAPFRRYWPSPKWSTTTGWAMIFCLLGAAGIFQPFVPLAELQVLDYRDIGVPIAQVFGYESMYTFVVGVIFASLFLLLIATSFIQPIPLWRPFLIILAGIGASLVMSLPIQSNKPAKDEGRKEDEVDPPKSARFVVLGNVVTVSGTVPSVRELGDRVFQVSGTTTVVREDSDLARQTGKPDGKQMFWPGLIKVAITFIPRTIIALSFGLLLLGAIQLRGVLMWRRLKPGG